MVQVHDYESKDSKKLHSPLKTPWRHILLLYCSYVSDRPPSIYYLCFGCNTFIIHFSKVSLMTTIVPVLNLLEKCIISFSRYLYFIPTIIPYPQDLEKLYTTPFIDVQRNCASRLTIQHGLSLRSIQQQQRFICYFLTFGLLVFL